MKSDTKDNVLFILSFIGALVLAFIIFSFSYNTYKHLPVVILAIAAVVFIILKRKYLLFISICMVAFILIFNHFETQWRNVTIVPSKALATLKWNDRFYADSNGIYIANNDSFKGINRHGFRTRDFVDHGCDSTRPKVMFLGDSYTWGATATPIDSSYVDLVDDAGYCTFNTGIGGTDPAQYTLIGEKYMKLIDPDIVILMFSLESDIVNCKRIIKPYTPIFYATGGGMIDGWLINAYKTATCPEEPFDSYEEAIEYFRKSYRLYDESFLGNTSIGTFISSTFTKPMEFPYVEYPDYSVTDWYLQQIQDMCDDLGIPLWLYMIPGREDVITDIEKIKTEIPNLFQEYKTDLVFCPQDLNEDDYLWGNDSHIHNVGHKKYAVDIIQRLDSYFYNSK